MKSKQTKKRLGVVAVMLLLVIAIGATAGTTLAKYITSATVDSKTAAVAKWGYTVTTNAEDLFGKQYSDGKIVADDGEIDVDVAADYYVVAPGTSSEGADKSGTLSFTINGTAEVDAKLTIDVTDFETVWLNPAKIGAMVKGEEEEEEFELGEDIYYPLVWTVSVKADNFPKEATLELDFSEKDEEQSNAELLAEQISENLAQLLTTLSGTHITVADYEEGSQVVINCPIGTEFKNFTLSIAWKWEIETEKTKAEDETPATYYNVEDTVLGWLAYNDSLDEAGTPIKGGTSSDGVNEITVSGLDELKAGEDYNLEVKFGCKVTIEQVQTKDQASN